VDRPRSPGFGVTFFRRTNSQLFGMLAESDRIKNLEASTYSQRWRTAGARRSGQASARTYLDREIGSGAPSLVVAAAAVR
jgi:hypothetical protein